MIVSPASQLPEGSFTARMYIEYITPQRVADPNITEYKSNGGKYRPTWLIRVSDWQKVRGHEAREGYHTLSYCWEQSGEIVKKDHGEYDCLNKPHHRLTKRIPDKRRRLCFSKYRRRRDVEVTLEVTYDDVLQQLCKDFNIDYLWYDKVCIDQTNKEEKKREIKQMHLIYSNACYTIALVPEIDVDDPSKFENISWEMDFTEAKRVAFEQMLGSLWWRRSWTLEEVMMSTRIVVVGKNTHFWSLARDKQDSTSLKENDFLCVQMLGFKDKKWKSANQVLTDAHFRTSSKEHDKIFALANILHDIISIDIDYKSDLAATINSFYRQLIERDMSVMCFGSILLQNGEPQYLTTMDSYGLPSWTGVAGLHAGRPIIQVARDQNSSYSIDDDMRLYIKCMSYTIQPIKYSDYDMYTDHQREQQAEEYYIQYVITSMSDFDGDKQAALDYSQHSMYQGTSCLATHYWELDNPTALCPPILPLSLTEDCDECVILGMLFDSVTGVFAESDDSNWALDGYTHDYFLPVLKKSSDGSAHRAIGIILLKHFLEDEAPKDPKEFLTEMFGIIGGNLDDFIVE